MGRNFATQKTMKVSCHSCLSWKECAQTKVKLAQTQYIKSRTYTAHFWTEFAINEIIQVLEASQYFVVVYSAAHQMQSVKKQNHKLSEVKIFSQLLPFNITRRSLKYYELKNIYHLSFNKDQVRYTEGNNRMGVNINRHHIKKRLLPFMRTSCNCSTIMNIHKKKTKLPKNEENTFDKLSFALHKLLC